MDNLKITKIIFILLTAVFFLVFTILFVEPAYREVSKKAEDSIQIALNEDTKKIFYDNILNKYSQCKIKTEKHKRVHKHFKNCEKILKEMALIDNDKKVLTNISKYYYSYNWQEEYFLSLSGKIVYKMTDKDQYLTSKQCWNIFIKKIIIAVFKSFILSLMFYFVLVSIQDFLKDATKNYLKLGIYLGLFLITFFGMYSSSFDFTKELGQGVPNLPGNNFNLPHTIGVDIKIIVTILAGLIIYKEFYFSKPGFWFWGFCIIAIIFNPVIPIPIGYKIVNFVNLIVLIFFFSYLVKEYNNSKN